MNLREQLIALIDEAMAEETEPDYRRALAKTKASVDINLKNYEG